MVLNRTISLFFVGALIIFAYTILQPDGSIDDKEPELIKSKNHQITKPKENEKLAIESPITNNLVINNKELEIDDSTKSYDDYYKEGDIAGHALLFAKRQYMPFNSRDTFRGDIEAGDVMEIASTRGIKPTAIIPIYGNGIVRFLATYRKYDGSEYALATMEDVSSYNWEHYPPLDVSSAEMIIYDEFPTATITGPGVVSFYSNKSDPQFEFPVYKNGADGFVYVDINSSSLNTAEEFVVIEDTNDEHPFYLSNEGNVEVDTSKVSLEDQEFWQEEARVMNIWVERDMLVFDENMNVILDNRPDSAFEN